MCHGGAGPRRARWVRSFLQSAAIGGALLPGVEIAWLGPQRSGDRTQVPPAAPVRLAPGVRYAGDLSGGSTGVFEVALERGFIARLRVDQRDVDVAVECSAPDGSRHRVDGRENVAETISLIGEAAGLHRCVVAPVTPLVKPRRFAIELEALRPVEPADAVRVAAERTETEGKRQFTISNARPGDLLRRDR